MAMPYPKSMHVPAPDKVAGHAHPGLIFSHLFNGYRDDFTDLEETRRDNRRHVEISDPKKDFMRLCQGGQTAWRDMRDDILARQAELVRRLGGEAFIVSSRPGSPFLTGIGISHPLENGFLWHPVYPCPFVPGSGIKGLLRAWFETSKTLAEKEKRTLLKALFGSDHKDPKKAEEDFVNGGLVFFDALPAGDWRMDIQMLTPHMGKYYEKGRKKPGEWNTIPADWHQPVPVPFMALENISLLIGFAPSSTAGDIDDEQLGMIKEHLLAALNELGLGAKTSLGFGRFQLDESESERLNKTLEEQAEAEREAAEMASLSEEERTILMLSRKIESAQNHQSWEPGQADFSSHLKPVLDEMEVSQDPHLLNLLACQVLEPWIRKTGKDNYWKGGKAKGKKNWPNIARAFSQRNCN